MGGCGPGWISLGLCRYSRAGSLCIVLWGSSDRGGSNAYSVHTTHTHTHKGLLCLDIHLRFGQWRGRNGSSASLGRAVGRGEDKKRCEPPARRPSHLTIAKRLTRPDTARQLYPAASLQSTTLTPTSTTLRATDGEHDGTRRRRPGARGKQAQEIPIAFAFCWSGGPKSGWRWRAVRGQAGSRLVGVFGPCERAGPESGAVPVSRPSCRRAMVQLAPSRLSPPLERPWRLWRGRLRKRVWISGRPG